MTYPTIPSQGQYSGQLPQGQPTTNPIGVLPQASYLYSSGGPQPYPFSTQAYFNPLQEQGFGTSLQGLQHGVGQGLQNQALAQGLMGGFQGYQAQAGSNADPGYINQIGGSFNPWENPALDSAVQNANQALTRDFNQGAMPQIDSSALGAGQFGSSRHGVQEGIAKQGLADALAAQTAGMYSTGFEQGMNRYTQDRSNTLNTWLGANRNALSGWQTAAPLANMTMGANMDATGALQNLGAGQANVGGAYQANANSELSQQRQLWDSYQQQPYKNLDWYSGIVQGTNNGAYGTQTQTGPEASWVPNAIGGGLMAYGAYNQFSGGGGGSSPGLTPSGGGSNYFGLNYDPKLWGG